MINAIDALETIKSLVEDVKEKEESLTSILDQSFEIKHGCITERVRRSFYNPPILATAIKIDFDFLLRSIDIINKANEKIENMCEGRIKGIVQSYKIVHGETDQCIFPLPIYQIQRKSLAKHMRHYGTNYVKANIKFENGQLMTFQNERIPMRILDWLGECSMDMASMNNTTNFVFQFYNDKNIHKDSTLRAPCPTNDKRIIQNTKTLCVDPSTAFRHIDSLCNEYSEATATFSKQLSVGNDQLQGEIFPHLNKEKRGLFLLALVTVAIFTSLISVASTAMATHSTVAVSRIDADIDTLMENQNNMVRDIRTLSHFSFQQAEAFRILKEDVAFLSKLLLLHDSAKREFEYAKDKLTKIFNILDTCKNSRKISTMALTRHQKEFIQRLATNKSESVDLDEGFCSLKKDNSSLYMTFEFPLKDAASKVEVIKTTCLPIFKDGYRYSPIMTTNYAAVFYNRKFAPLTEAEFHECANSNICYGTSIIIPSEGVCGIQNYLGNENACSYAYDDPQPIAPFYAHSFKDKILLHGPENMDIEQSCMNNESPVPVRITMAKGPTVVKTNEFCRYKVGDSSYQAGTWVRLLFVDNNDINHGQAYGSNAEVIETEQVQLPKITSKYLSRAAQFTRQAISHTATAMVTVALIGFFILILCFCWLYKHFNTYSYNPRESYSASYNTEGNTTSFLAPTYKNDPELNPIKLEFKTTPQPLPRFQHGNYENLPKMMQSSPKVKDKRLDQVAQRQFQEDTMNLSVQ